MLLGPVQVIPLAPQQAASAIVEGLLVSAEGRDCPPAGHDTQVSLPDGTGTVQLPGGLPCRDLQVHPLVPGLEGSTGYYRAIGALDTATEGSSPANLHIRGWALDPDYEGGVIDVDVYADGVGLGRFPAEQSRADVDALYPVHHAFDLSVKRRPASTTSAPTPSAPGRAGPMVSTTCSGADHCSSAPSANPSALSTASRTTRHRPVSEQSPPPGGRSTPTSRPHR